MAIRIDRVAAGGSGEPAIERDGQRRSPVTARGAKGRSRATSEATNHRVPPQTGEATHAWRKPEGSANASMAERDG